MNIHWNYNLIIFAMALVSTCLDDQIMIRVSRAHRCQLRVKLGQIWLKLLKNCEELGFDIKPWKILFCENFDLVWPSVKPRLTRGILTKKDTLNAPMFKQVAPHHYKYSHDLMERKWHLWVFQGLARKSRADEIQYQYHQHPNGWYSCKKWICVKIIYTFLLFVTLYNKSCLVLVNRSINFQFPLEYPFIS